MDGEPANWIPKCIVPPWPCPSPSSWAPPTHHPLGFSFHSGVQCSLGGQLLKLAARCCGLKLFCARCPMLDPWRRDVACQPKQLSLVFFLKVSSVGHPHSCYYSLILGPQLDNTHRPRRQKCNETILPDPKGGKICGHPASKPAQDESLWVFPIFNFWGFSFLIRLLLNFISPFHWSNSGQLKLLEDQNSSDLPLFDLFGSSFPPCLPLIFHWFKGGKWSSRKTEIADLYVMNGFGVTGGTMFFQFKIFA